MKLSVTVSVNGRAHQHEVEPRLLLVHFLRDVIGLTGTKIGCDTSQCGACTVLIDGVAAKSCTCLTAQADGCSVTTIEGLADGGQLHVLQEAFWTKHGLQCGFCTPGMIFAAHELLRTDATAVATASTQVRADLKDDVIGDIYASAEYRTAMAPVYVARAVAAAVARAGLA